MCGDFIECTLSFLLGAEVEPLTKFSNDGGGGGGRLTGSQFLEGVARKERVNFFKGGGLQFLLKNKLKAEIFNNKKRF